MNLVQTLEFAPRFLLSITSHGWVKQPDCCSALVFYTRGFVIFGFDNLLSHLRKSQSPLKALVLYIIKIDGGRPKKPLHESFKGHMILKGAEKLAPTESVYYDDSLLGFIVTDFFDLEHK